MKAKVAAWRNKAWGPRLGTLCSVHKSELGGGQRCRVQEAIRRGLEWQDQWWHSLVVCAGDILLVRVIAICPCPLSIRLRTQSIKKSPYVCSMEWTHGRSWFWRAARGCHAGDPRHGVLFTERV